MANDAIGQAIPSWVEDDSYQVQSKITFAINDGHPSPSSLSEFRTLWRNMYDGQIVRDGEVKDNSAYDGKFLVDKQRTFNKADELPSQLNVTGENNVDGGQPAIIPMIAGEDADDTTNYGQTQWIGNSGLDVYGSPYKFYNGSTEVSKTDDFDSVVKLTYWKLASDFKKASCNEYNPIATTGKRTLPGNTGDDTHMSSDAQNVAPTDTNLHLQEDGRGETYTTKIVCANDFLVSGAGMKFKLEKVTDTENIVPEVDKWRLSNGYGRAQLNNTWVTHTPKVIGQARIFKDCYNFTGGSRVSTTLQDIDSGVFGLPSGHPLVETQSEDIQGAIDFTTHFPDEAGYNDGTQVIANDKQVKFGE